jgi:ATPase subunit of ABC transporter with duplicated ATPase domains
VITTSNLSLQFGTRILFEDVSLKFTRGNCYGLIGANGAGKSTFLKILSREIEPSGGEIAIQPKLRMSVLEQDHFEYNEVDATTTVLMGHQRLYQIIGQKDALYAKADFSDADGIRAAELEAEFADLNGWEAEAQAAELLAGLGLAPKLTGELMKNLDDGDKVRVLLARALFGDPDILLLDEPTNHLAVDSILWLEEFLVRFDNLVIVVSHDRHFLNKICTHTADIDFQKVSVYTGNYDFWKQASDLALAQKRAANKKAEEKAGELKAFIARFSANAKKSRQATARKKMLSQLELERIPPSTRKYPHIVFDPAKIESKKFLSVSELAVSDGDRPLFRNVSFKIGRNEKVVFTSVDSQLPTALLQTLAGERKADSGTISWGNVTRGYFPKDHGDYFRGVQLNLVDWLRQYSEDQSEGFVRSFLGRMLFSGEESEKQVDVLSGGERVRCMISRLMLQNPQCLILDGPTNHLDLESITSLNNALIKFPANLLFGSQDVEFISTIADRVIEITAEGVIDRPISYEDYLSERAEALGLSAA